MDGGWVVDRRGGGGGAGQGARPAGAGSFGAYPDLGIAGDE